MRRSCYWVKKILKLKDSLVDSELFIVEIRFDAHQGFSHAVYGGWVVCEEHKEVVIAAYEEEEIRNNKKIIEKQQERVWGNWRKLIKGLEIRERIKLKYGTEDTDGHTISKTKTIVNDSDDEHDNKIQKSAKKAATSQDETVKSKPVKQVVKPKAKVTKPRSKRTKKVVSDDDDEDYQMDDEDYEEYPKKARTAKNKPAPKPKASEKNEKKDIFDKIASQNLVENEKNSEKSESVVNDEDDLMLSEEED